MSAPSITRTKSGWSGWSDPNSKIELLNGKWGGRSGLQGRAAVLKTLRLSNVKLVDPVDYAVLAVGRPRQGTIMQWHLAGKTVENLVPGRRSKPQLSDLAPSQQEILCSEFLRLPEAASLGLPRLAHLLLPTGRTMQDIDIDGIATDAKRLLAQVTFSPLEIALGRSIGCSPIAMRSGRTYFSSAIALT